MIGRLLATEVFDRLENDLSAGDRRRCLAATKDLSRAAGTDEDHQSLEEFLGAMPAAFAAVESMCAGLVGRVERFIQAAEEPFHEPWLRCAQLAAEFYATHGEDVDASSISAQPMEWSERMPHRFNCRYAVSGGTAPEANEVAVSVRVSRTLFDRQSLEAAWFILSHEFVCHAFAASLGQRPEAEELQAFSEGWMQRAALQAHCAALRDERPVCLEIARAFDASRLEPWREDARIAELCPTAPESEADSALREGWTIGARAAEWTEDCFRLILGRDEGSTAWAALSVALNRSELRPRRLFDFAAASRALLKPDRAHLRGDRLERLLFQTATTFSEAPSRGAAIDYTEQIIEIWRARQPRSIIQLTNE